MRRLLDSGVGTLRTKMNFAIELDETKYYFPGDPVRGKVILESPKTIKIVRIRLIWTGQMRISLGGNRNEDVVLFREITNVDISDARDNGQSVIKGGKAYAFPFCVGIPNQAKLPSCTEREVSSGVIIEYIMQAVLERPMPEFTSLKAELRVPILDRIDISTPENSTPPPEQEMELFGTSENRASPPGTSPTATIRVSVPRKGYIRDQAIPITIVTQCRDADVQVEPLAIALIRTCEIVCKEKTYKLSDVIVHQITVSSRKGKHTSETITRYLLIPKTIPPTLNVDNVSVNYLILVKPHDYSYTESGKGPSLVTRDDPTEPSIEIPIVIGTFPLKENTEVEHLGEAQFARDVTFEILPGERPKGGRGLPSILRRTSDRRSDLESQSQISLSTVGRHSLDTNEAQGNVAQRNHNATVSPTPSIRLMQTSLSNATLLPPTGFVSNAAFTTKNPDIVLKSPTVSVSRPAEPPKESNIQQAPENDAGGEIEYFEMFPSSDDEAPLPTPQPTPRQTPQLIPLTASHLNSQSTPKTDASAVTVTRSLSNSQSVYTDSTNQSEPVPTPKSDTDVSPSSEYRHNSLGGIRGNTSYGLEQSAAFEKPDEISESDNSDSSDTDTPIFMLQRRERRLARKTKS